MFVKNNTVQPYIGGRLKMSSIKLIFKKNRLYAFGARLKVAGWGLLVFLHQNPLISILFSAQAAKMPAPGMN